MALEKILPTVSLQKLEKAMEFRNRMATYPDCVEYVNNMYGCHDKRHDEYFTTIFN